MKGGVSSSMGRTSEGMVTMWCVAMKSIRLSKVARKALSSWSGAGWSAPSSSRTARGVFVGLEFFGDLGELLLILVQVGKADLEQLVERDVDHLVVLKFLREGVGADAEVAVGAGKQIGLDPVEIVFSAAMTAALVCCELGLERGIFGVGEGRGHIVLEEADDAGQLFDGDLGEDVRRVLEVGARLVERDGISFSRAMSERRRSSAGANLRSISENAPLAMPPE